MKSTDLWKSLPTAAELLENPRVRSVVDRLNPTVVTARVRSFLDEVRGELLQRAEDAGLPTLSELADRVSRYLTARGQHRVVGAINATGRFRGEPWAGGPLADAALEQMLLAAQDFTLIPADTTAEAEVEQRTCELTGAEGAMVVNNHVAALHLVLSSLEPRRVVVARGELTTLEIGCRLTDLSDLARAELTEVGAVDAVRVEDYQSASKQGAAWLTLSGSTAAAACRPSLAELSANCSESNALLIVEIGAAALNGDTGIAGVTAAEAIKLGAALVLVRGDGLIGGPNCGLILGARDAIARIKSLPLASTIKLDVPRLAALAATLRIHADPDQAKLAIPALTLTTTPLDNLRTRAERIAAQIAECQLAERAAAVELPIGRDINAARTQPTWGVRVWHARGSSSELARELAEGATPVVGVVEEESLLLDLRTVFPRQDIPLVAAFTQAGPDGHADETAMEAGG